MVPIPQNLTLLAENKYPEILKIIEEGRTDIIQNLLDIGKYFKVKITFSEPVEISVISRWSPWYIDDDGRNTRTKSPSRVTTSTHIFNGFFLYDNYSLCYKFKRNGRRGYYLPVNKIIKYEPVIKTEKKTCFDSYEDFRKKFNTHFITEDEIKKLWNGTSGQHGGKYVPSDFRKIGKKGKATLKRFLERFKGVNTINNAGYQLSSTSDPKPSYYLTEKQEAWAHSGRDISISHLYGNSYVWYSSEYANCGNGRYGLLANRNEFLWLEDD